jgi:hypothetical protein
VRARIRDVTGHFPQTYRASDLLFVVVDALIFGLTGAMGHVVEGVMEHWMTSTDMQKYSPKS